MESLFITKKKKAAASETLPIERLRRGITSELASAAGISSLRHRDPVYELGTCFQSSFDQFAMNQTETNLNIDQKNKPSAQNGGNQEEQLNHQESNQTRDFPSYQHAPQGKPDESFYRRFSQTALQNGKLSGAVMQGTGKTMFISCLQRACGVPFRPNDKQKTLFADSAANVPVKNYSARLQFNRWVHGAAGIVVDSLMNADRVLSMLETLADENSSSVLEGNEVDTFRQMFPFLSVQKEQEMLSRYESALKAIEKKTGDPETVQKKMVLTEGLNKARAVIDRKRQMKAAFMVKLRELLSRSREMREALELPANLGQFATEVFGPPEEENPDDSENNRNEKQKDQSEMAEKTKEDS